ncbi:MULTISPECIES: 1-deoxy-D-xylulose-5-phosphate synthase [unclassified Lentimonas]|uniref:1-deoxy-D-xylulose-5-phosphate synthase n=1 Tax=unclassified Lentimonas TaxID=2630993 RepID=UPI00132C65A2|nr:MULTISPECIES: 1-deoxy-D-xylulose-5-phosphate synthase [unclassified Lentimonas]CAA6678914.1 1-deoxy-D-xylulose 5-phosphate synthase (EC [Lentimonas sp. CC4]CAA6684520.1 1-deoxy-D-xylulose 5-phosphate synthase (EC [Lentimonas sp. CC6]CAA7077402.1 1-deoxy-D-xylulose 5-phosphate synthase (EC [Lentimonas sp. CC4]CAA7171238.1 1-deoxy-D-xylulose 5-phosphate synthase (EC [Lentimonas sp. CC21]CAA7183267.1 1-deoxy-D-xylulose 5-phosphate synthase (EC [Lentimonas sp. CC8]
MGLLERIKSPDDVKQLSEEQLPELAAEIRERIIKATSINGGHVGPNLGVVELSIGLHRVFNTPKDRFVFDVAHQGYVHKLLTGRNGKDFDKIRQCGGLSGFLNRSESEHDAFGAGHAGTALSAALGMATARDKRGSDEHVVALCGDAAFTCGITMEALNNVATSTKRLIIILNDNKWSIAKNVGALPRYFNELITNPVYNRLNDDFESLLQKLPGGESIIQFGSKWKKETKDFLVPSSLFEKFNVRYIGPIDGHDQAQVEHYLEFAKQAEQPVLLHILTTKGKGYDVALQNPERFHGASPFDIKTGKGAPATGNPGPKYQDVMGNTLVKLAKQDKSIVGITAAMPAGTGLNILEKELPDQFIDVGIAEEHAVLSAAGMATSGFHPVCAIYSTFLQRAYDQLIHDVALQHLPVMFCMDRAGLSPNDGATHHGLFDLTYLRNIPGVVVMAPSNEDELADMMATGIAYQGPSFVRYPRGEGPNEPIKEMPIALPLGKAERLQAEGEIEIWAIGSMVADAEALAQQLHVQGIQAGVINARFVKPLDTELLLESAQSAKLIVTMEDNIISGGFGTAIMEALQEANSLRPVVRIGWPDQFVEHGNSVAALRASVGIDPESILEKVLTRYRALES